MKLETPLRSFLCTSFPCFTTTIQDQNDYYVLNKTGTPFHPIPVATGKQVFVSFPRLLQCIFQELKRGKKHSIRVVKALNHSFRFFTSGKLRAPDGPFWPLSSWPLYWAHHLSFHFTSEPSLLFFSWRLFPEDTYRPRLDFLPIHSLFGDFYLYILAGFKTKMHKNLFRRTRVYCKLFKVQTLYYKQWHSMSFFLIMGFKELRVILIPAATYKQKFIHAHMLC